MSEFLLSVQDTQKGRMVIACDAAIVGETFSEDAVRLEVSEGFYGGESADIETVISALERMFTANLVGTELIEGLVDAGVITDNEYRTVDGVHHAQLFTV